MANSICWDRFFSNLSSYEKFLSRLRSLIGAAGNQLHTKTTPLPELAIFQMAAWIDADVAALRQLMPWRDSAFQWRTPDGAALPSIHGLPDAAGVIYVLEGSLNGGPLLERMLTDSVPEVSVDVRTFFRAAGMDRASHWGAVQRWLDQTLRARADLERAIASAERTFLVIETHLGVLE
ncbi:MAG: biliverdin-producing heme oxygenase [Planctomycetales bacterium]|nr:biliverdin-producing heme oxygenase [Planctomycetales bacterium]